MQTTKRDQNGSQSLGIGVQQMPQHYRHDRAGCPIRWCPGWDHQGREPRRDQALWRPCNARCRYRRQSRAQRRPTLERSGPSVAETRTCWIPEATDAVSVLYRQGWRGKTSLSTAAALILADAGKKVLLVSTDAASNLDEMLGIQLRNTPTPVPGAPGLSVLNIDPDTAAESYRQRVLAQMAVGASDTERSTVREQLSGACTTEIASFDEFATLLSGDVESFDHISSTRHRLDTPCACSACPRHGVDFWMATTAEPHAWDRIRD